MYWIYLLIFVVVVFVPDLVNRGFWGLGEKSIEELALFILGGTAFLLYLVKENKLSKYMKEKARLQRDANRMSKDLTNSYSYIGEINRKLEIFKNISLGLPTWSRIPRIREKESFEYIMAAVKIITRSDEYTLRFVDAESFETKLEIKSKKSLKVDVSAEDCLKEGKKYFETEEFMIAVSPEDIKGVLSLLTIKKKNYASSSDDPDILKAICSQALFLYMYSRRDRHKNQTEAFSQNDKQ